MPESGVDLLIGEISNFYSEYTFGEVALQLCVCGGGVTHQERGNLALKITERGNVCGHHEYQSSWVNMWLISLLTNLISSFFIYSFENVQDMPILRFYNGCSTNECIMGLCK